MDLSHLGHPNLLIPGVPKLTHNQSRKMELMRRIGVTPWK